MKSFPAAPEGDFVVGMARGRHLWTSRVTGRTPRPGVAPRAAAPEPAPAPAPEPPAAAPQAVPVPIPAPPQTVLERSSTGSGLATLIGAAIRQALEVHLADVPAERRGQLAANVQHAVLSRLAQDVHAGLGTTAPVVDAPAAAPEAPDEYHALFEEGAFAAAEPRVEAAETVAPAATPAPGPRRLEEAWVEALRRSFDELGEGVEGDAAALVEEAISLTIQAAREERETIAGAAAEPYAGRIDNLRRRVAKLRETLKGYHFLLKKVRNAKTVDQGVASIYRRVQGLPDTDPQGEKKRGMLIEVFRQNLRLLRRRRRRKAG